MKSRLLTILSVGFISHYALQMLAAAIYEWYLQGPHGYAPFEMALYFGPVYASFFCLFALLGAVLVLDRLSDIAFPRLTRSLVVLAFFSVGTNFTWNYLVIPRLDNEAFYDAFPAVGDLILSASPLLIVVGACIVWFRYLTVSSPNQ